MTVLGDDHGEITAKNVLSQRDVATFYIMQNFDIFPSQGSHRNVTWSPLGLFKGFQRDLTGNTCLKRE